MIRLLSIITINYNNADGLQKTINSLLVQDFTEYELIIIDGGSTDGSTEIIQQHATDITYWVSEKDSGIYNAMNKGISKAKGESLFFLNSGDEFFDGNVLKKMSAYFDNADIVYGNLLIREPGRDWIKYYNEPITFEYFTRDTLPHQGAFIKKSLFETIGLYDEHLRITSDWKFFLDAVCKYNASTKYINEIIAVYDYTGISSRPEYFATQILEKETVFNNDYPLYIGSCRELHELRELKAHYESLSNNFLVKIIFAVKVKSRILARKLKKIFKR